MAIPHKKRDRRAYNKAWRTANLERARCNHRKWRKKNAQKVRDYANEWRKNNLNWKKNYYFERTYGITQDQFNILFEQQNGQCKICKTDKEKLLVDHCHSSGRVRGLLCSACNKGLGFFKDNKEFLSNAIEYIK